VLTADGVIIGEASESCIVVYKQQEQEFLAMEK